MDDLATVADKSFRLAQDARLLFDNDRYETALSLSVLSIEEAGKFLLLSGERRDENLGYKVRKHPRKQQRAALSLLVRQMIAGLEAVKKMDRTEQWLDPAFEPTDEDLLKVWRLLSFTGVFDFNKAAHNGELDRLKQAGFYVDFGEERLSADAFKAHASTWLPQAEALADDVVRLQRAAER